MKGTTHIKSIHQLHQIAGLEPPKHPLFSIYRLEDIRLIHGQLSERMTYDFFSVGLKKNLEGFVKYGRTNYDFQEGVLGFTAPYQVMEFSSDLLNKATGWIFFFKKEFLNESILLNNIDQFGFFNYQTNEGLHLSKTEENSLETIFNNIKTEYDLPIDSFSKQVVISNLELLLTYSHRYYNRQFIIRNEVDTSIFSKFKQLLKAYFKETDNIGLPTVELLSKQLHISANYLSDYLKATTGKSAIEHIHNKIIEIAKSDLLASEKSIGEIAFQLGFEYPHYFSRLFKKKTGLTPTEFRIKSK